MSKIIKNLWNNTTFYCGHDHNEPVKMEYKTGESMFYSCPRYYVDNKNRPGERSCANRMSFADAEKILDKITDEITEIEEAGGVVNIKNLQFDYNGIHVKVLSHDPISDKLEVEILNRKALK